MEQLIKKVSKFIVNKDYRFLCLANLGYYNFLDDKSYLERKFKAIMGKDLDLNHPLTMNEKLQWLKLYNHQDVYVNLVDKVVVRDYIAKVLGSEYLIPSIGVWDNPDAIDFSALPNQFVLKCNHNSGLGMCICTNKDELDYEKARKELWRGYKQNYYLTGREWPYKNVRRKIIGEVYMTDNKETNSFTDYKFYCFNGYVDSVMVCIDREKGDPKYYFFDKTWVLKRYNLRGKEAPSDFSLPKPMNIEKMFEIASILSVGIPFVRVDLYNVDGHIYFGEMTFYPQSGFDANRLFDTDLYFGNLIDLKLLKERNL